MKTRFVFSAFCMLVAMTMATGAFAQGIFIVSSGPEARGRANGQAELSGGISVTMTAGTFTVDHSGTVVIDYGVPITNAVGPAGDGVAGNNINVNICTAVRLEAAGGDVGANRVTMSRDKTMLTVHVAAQACAPNTSINVDNVRLALAGSGQSSIDASVSTTGHIRGVGTVQATVISAVVDELTDAGVTAKALEVTRHTGVPVGGPSAQFRLVIEENTNDSFEGAEINLEFSGLPEDVTVTLDAWVATKKEYEDMKVMTAKFSELAEGETDIVEDLPANMNDQVSIGSRGARVDTVESDDTKTTVFIADNMFNLDDNADDDPEGTGGSLNSAEIDVVIVLGSISGTDDEDLLPLSLEIAVTADVGPIGVRNPEGTQHMFIPRFATDKSAPVTVIEATPAQTTLQVAYVISEGPYDTGISVANMTSGRTAQSGAVHFSLFMDGNEITHSTGMAGPQSSVTILLSEVLRAAGHTGNFKGYMLIEADFNKADAGVFISDFAGFTAGATVHKVP